LARIDYDLVIPTNNILSPQYILELVPVIKSKYPKAHIMVLSGYRSDDFDSKLWRCGVVDIFPLPFEMSDLVSRVEEILLP